MANKAPADVKSQIRDAAQSVAEYIAADARARARRSNKQLAATAQTIRASRDRIPTVKAASARRVTSSGAKAHEIFWGAEFGTTGAFPQFPRRVREGRSIYPAIGEHRDEAARMYLDRIERVFEQ